MTVSDEAMCGAMAAMSRNTSPMLAACATVVALPPSSINVVGGMGVQVVDVGQPCKVGWLVNLQSQLPMLASNDLDLGAVAPDQGLIGSTRIVSWPRHRFSKTGS